jgi:hypothetical protein
MAASFLQPVIAFGQFFNGATINL